MTLDINIEIIESQIDNNPLGTPDNGLPEKALGLFLTHYPDILEECVHVDGFNFIIWNDETPDQYLRMLGLSIMRQKNRNIPHTMNLK